MEINDALIVQWEPKINRMLQTTSIRGMDREDIAQELRIAILKAAKGFDPERKVSFHTYLHTTMINTIRTLITKAQRRPQPHSLELLMQSWDTEANSQTKRFSKVQKAMEVNVDMDSFMKLRIENLTMDEITKTLQESAYKIRARIKQKLGGRVEKRLSRWLNVTENN